MVNPGDQLLFRDLAAEHRPKEYLGVFTTVNLDQGGQVPALVNRKVWNPALTAA